MPSSRECFAPKGWQVAECQRVRVAVAARVGAEFGWGAVVAVVAGLGVVLAGAGVDVGGTVGGGGVGVGGTTAAGFGAAEVAGGWVGPVVGPASLRIAAGGRAAGWEVAAAVGGRIVGAGELATAGWATARTIASTVLSGVGWRIEPLSLT